MSAAASDVGSAKGAGEGGSQRAASQGRLCNTAGSLTDFGDATLRPDLTLKPGGLPALAAGDAGDPMAATDGFFAASSRKRKKRNPGVRWDGRFDNLSLEEYRDMKWSMDACFNNTRRTGARYTCRPLCPRKPLAGSDPMLLLNTASAFNASRRVGPSLSMGCLLLSSEADKSQGPAQYKIPSTMDAKSHPSIPKHTGAKFGTETLKVNDEETPAPGEYDHNAVFRSGQIPQAPRYTMPGREAWKPRVGAKEMEPAPGEYKTECTTRVGKDTPFTWTAQGRTDPREPPCGSERVCIAPGPPHYKPPGAGAINEHCARQRPPKWGFGSESRGLA